MFLTQNNLHALIHFVLLNAYSTGNPGIRAGKAGVALSLFELARQMKQEYLDDYAADLLQHSMLYDGKNISVTDGTSGIGMTLNYLIHNGFVEANYQEVFGKQQELIYRVLVSGALYASPPFQLCEYLVFINLTCEHIPIVVFKKLEMFLTLRLKMYLDFVFKKNLKEGERAELAYCASLLLYLGHKFEKYGNLIGLVEHIYQKYGVQYADWNVGFYMCRYGLKSKNNILCRMGETFLRYKLLDARPQLMRLGLKVNFIYYVNSSSLLRGIPEALQLHEKIIQSFAEQLPDLLELNITDSISDKHLYFGLGQGISRLLCLNACMESFNVDKPNPLFELICCC